MSAYSNRRREKKKNPRIKTYMNNKLTLLFVIVALAFILLAWKLTSISRNNGEEYKKQVLSQQSYDSTVIPFRRGSIVDRNGTTIAYSAQVYNVILDSKLMNADPEKIEPTLIALNNCFGLDQLQIRQFITQNPTNAYHILAKQLSYDQVQAYIELRDNPDNNICVNGIWFESEYKREYPYGTMAADVIGFTTKDNVGMYGLEEYYNDQLSGSNGRIYGYLTDDNALERTTIAAVNGNTIVTTLDTYIQSICEEAIIDFNETHANEYREGEKGSDNTGVIVMNVNTGEVLAMASYPGYDLNDPFNISDYYTAEEIALMEADGTYLEACNDIWKNFCISQSYEPGSVCKTFTIAAGLDSGTVHDSDVYYCGGFLKFGDGDGGATIRCHSRYGEGELTTQRALELSCNVALMQMGQRIGAQTYLKYFRNFNFGLKTNIDLAGEMRTASLVFNENTMGPTELATSTFGQGYNVTMIQTIAAYCSLVNGGYYYQPHVVSRIVDDSGATVESIEPVLLRQTVSESVSEYMRKYCIGVVENGTGTYARPYGYRIGGKTGTAEHSGAGKIDYVVSFMGFAPADDPQIAVYVVIDRPNTPTQDTATRYACLLCRDIMTDVLPYLNIYMTEELTDAEREELEQRGSHVFTTPTVSDNSVSENSVSANGVPESDGNSDEALGSQPDAAPAPEPEDAGTSVSNNDIDPDADSDSIFTNVNDGNWDAGREASDDGGGAFNPFE